jgi:tRNA(Ile)-lysidine synthase
VAHNKDDVVETFLINLSRGTGLRGITGIKPKQNKLIRPIMFARREDILNYCTQKQVEFREDSSNQSTKYTRNRLRHNIIPEFEKINPRFVHTAVENIERFQSAYKIYRVAIEDIKKKLIVEDRNDLRIDLEGLRNCEEQQTVLFEILSEYSFSKEVTSEILSVLDKEPGKRFYSKTHEVIKDRNHLILTPLHSKDAQRYYLDEGDAEIIYPVNLKLEIIENPEEYQIPTVKNIASLDYDKLTFPLIIRKWQKGDYFKPFGLNHYKKLSDFFIDRKYSILDKERTWLLTSGEEIVWIIGDRIDENFRITPQTQRILRIIYQPGGY